MAQLHISWIERTQFVTIMAMMKDMNNIACKLACCLQNQLDRHQKLHKPAEGSSINTVYACQHCHNVFDNPSRLRDHTKLHFRVR